MNEELPFVALAAMILYSRMSLTGESIEDDTTPKPDDELIDRAWARQDGRA